VNPDCPAVDLGTGRTARALAGGDSFSCALLDGGDVKCWGANALGQLGQGDTEDRGDDPDELGDALPPIDLGTGRSAIALASASSSVCAILDTHEVKCWGSGKSGQLGLGGTEPRGDQPGEMGDALPAVDLGTGRSAVQIFSGSSHVCAVLDDDELKCWGEGGNGQLGLGDIDDRGDQASEMGDALPAVDTGF